MTTPTSPGLLSATPQSVTRAMGKRWGGHQRCCAPLAYRTTCNATECLGISQFPRLRNQSCHSLITAFALRIARQTVIGNHRHSKIKRVDSSKIRLYRNNMARISSLERLSASFPAPLTQLENQCRHLRVLCKNSIGCTQALTVRN